MLRRTEVFPFLILALGVVVFFSGCDGAFPLKDQKEGKTDPKTSGPPPKAVIEDGVYDFGSMEVGQKLTHQFVIRNEGEGPLTLKKERTTCKCTLANLENAELAPGKSVTVELEWEAKGIDPTFSQAAYIATNDPKNEQIALVIKGRVDPSYEISPFGVWNIGEMTRQSVTEFEGKISSRVRGDFTFVKATSGNPLISVSVEPMTKEQLEEANKAKKGYLIKGKVAPGAPLGVFSEEVTLEFLVKGKEKSEAKFTVEGYYPGPFQIIGPLGWATGKMTMIFGRFSAQEGKIARLSMFVRDNPGPPIEITKIVSKPDFLKVTLKKDDSFQGKNRERYLMTIEVPPGAPPSQFYKENPAKIEVVTNNPLVGTMNIRVRMISY